MTGGSVSRSVGVLSRAAELQKLQSRSGTMGTDGFGYDPVFFVPELRKTFAQLTAEEKSAVSHRGRALSDFAEKLETFLK